MTKQTAGNNKILKAVKAEFNHLIYGKVFVMVNDGADLDAVREYVGRFYNDGCREECLARLFDAAK